MDRARATVVVLLFVGSILEASGLQAEQDEPLLGSGEAQVLEWRSMRLAANPLPIVLDPSAAGSDVVTETRLNGLCRLEVDILAPGGLTLMATIEAENLTSGGFIAAASQSLADTGGGAYTLSAVWNPCLPDQACYKFDLSGKLDCTIINDADCEVRVLTGDVNEDGHTDFTDVKLCSTKNGQPVNPNTTKYDINGDGAIDGNFDSFLIGTRAIGHSARPIPGMGAPAAIALQVNGSSVVDYEDIAGGFYLDVVVSSADPYGALSFGASLIGDPGFAYKKMEKTPVNPPPPPLPETGWVMNYCGSRLGTRPGMPNNKWRQAVGHCAYVNAAGSLPMAGGPNAELGATSDEAGFALNGLAVWLEFSSVPPPGSYVIDASSAYVGSYINADNFQSVRLGQPDLEFTPLTILNDCNNNGIRDTCDTSCGEPGGLCDVPGCGLSPDCNGNRIPDECEPDTDGDGLIDGCDNCPAVYNPGQEDGDLDGVGNACDSPKLIRARSRRSHAGRGEADIEITTVGTNNSETRRGGLQKLVLSFSEPVEAADGTPDGTEVTLSQGTVLSVGINGDEMIVGIAGVPDTVCVAVQLAGLVDIDGNPLAGDADVHVRVLAGDANNDGRTNLIDMAMVKMKNGSPTDPGKARFDINCDGNLDLIDMALTKSLNGGIATSCP